MEIVPFKAEHLRALSLQDAQAYLDGMITEADAQALEAQDIAYTGLVDGRPIVCAGIIVQWVGRAIAWAYLSREAGQHMPAIHRAVKRMFGALDIPRIEAHVTAGFEPGHRWVRMLGFKLETPEPMRKFLTTGEDAYLYARIR